MNMNLILTLYWQWFAFALVLIILESLGAGGLLVALSLAAASVGLIILFFNVVWQLQWILFSVFSVACTFFWWRIWQKDYLNTPLSMLNQPIQGLMNREVTLEEPIVNGRGRILINGVYWTVSGKDLPKGSKVKIVSVDNDILVVKLVE